MRTLSLLFITIYTNLLCAQHIADFSFNQSHSGYSYHIGYSYKFKNTISVGGGIRVQQNVRNTSDQGNVFYHAFHAQKPIEHIGGYLDINYYPFKKSKVIMPFLYYKATLTRSSLKIKAYNYLGSQIDTFGQKFELYTLIEDVFESCYNFENYIGIGTDIKIYKGLLFSQRIGAGIALIYDIDSRILTENGKPNTWEFGWNYSFGLRYLFDKKGDTKK